MADISTSTPTPEFYAAASGSFAVAQYFCPTPHFRLKPDGLQQLWRESWTGAAEWRYVQHVGEDAPDNEIGEMT